MQGKQKAKKVVIAYDRDQIGRLRCDAPGCGYVTPDTKPFAKEMIGLPCPKCGASLLTERDYNAAERLLSVVDTINMIFGPIFGRVPSAKNAKEFETVKVGHHHGRWDIEFKE